MPRTTFTHAANLLVTADWAILSAWSSDSHVTNTIILSLMLIMISSWPLLNSGHQDGVQSLPMISLLRMCGKSEIIGNDCTDRKSTRLNSSHLVISYAVFCLKKKKKKSRIICDSDTLC